MTGYQSYLFKEDELCFTDKMVQAQVQAYEIDNSKLPTGISELETQGYLKQKSCPNGDSINIDNKGKVTVVE